MDDFVRRVLELRIGSKYQLIHLLGSGTFGKVYLGQDVDTNNQVAIKLEHHTVEPSLLDEEVDIYKSLTERPGFPRVYWHGFQDDFRVMVFELLGPNLEDLLRYCGNRFSLKTTLMLADQLLSRFESLHSNCYLHRDVKPENFLLGTEKQGNTVYITDLGLAVYRQPERGQTVSSSQPRTIREPRLIGTCRYASINGHLDVAQSPWDDLEALGYMLLYFLRGSLPWQGLRAPARADKYRRVLEIKQATSVNELCRDLPVTFATYMNYVLLRAVDIPNYRYLRDLFWKLFRQHGFEYDYVFDWTILEFQRNQTVTDINQAPPAQSCKPNVRS